MTEPEPGVVAAITAVVTSLIAGLSGMVLWLLNRGKFKAELEKIRADTAQTEEETLDLRSTRIIRELDRLAELNEQQAIEIKLLRTEIVKYATREIEHAAENAALRRQIEELKNPFERPVGATLREAYPLQIEHKVGEFDDQSRATDSDK